MKLLFCDSCGDVRKLGYKVTSCACGKVKAKYLEDGWHAEHNGEGFLLGIDNNTFLPTVQRYRYNAADRELPRTKSQARTDSKRGSWSAIHASPSTRS